MEKVKNNKRIEWIDSLKGAMMLAVIWSHSSANNTSGGYWITASYMAVFYFLSGYIFKDKNNGFPKFLLGKAKRLLIPYFSYGTLLVLIDAFIPMTPDDFDRSAANKWMGLLYSRYMLYPDNFSDNVFFLQSYDSTLWFLTSMFLTYLMFYCFLKSRKRRWFIIIAFVSGYILTFCPILLPWSVDTVPVTALIMCGGYYFKNLSCDSVSKKWKTAITTIILLVYVVAIKQNAGINLSIRCYGTGALAYIFYYVIAFTGAVLWTILFSKLPVNKGLQFIGKHGVTYMCLQLFTLSVSHKVFSKLISNPVILGWIGIGVTLVGVGIVIEMYDRLRMLMKMKCNSNGLLRP